MAVNTLIRAVPMPVLWGARLVHQPPRRQAFGNFYRPSVTHMLPGLCLPRLCVRADCDACRQKPGHKGNAKRWRGLPRPASRRRRRRLQHAQPILEFETSSVSRRGVYARVGTESPDLNSPTHQRLRSWLLFGASLARADSQKGGEGALPAHRCASLRHTGPVFPWQ
jgi:hypothetical protein